MSAAGHFRKSAQVNDEVRSDAVSGRRCPGPASPKSANSGHFLIECYGTALANYSSSNSRKSLIRSNGLALRLPI